MSRERSGPAALDELLARAGVLSSEYDDYDAQAALERIAGRVVRHKADTLDRRARQAHEHGCASRTSPSPEREWVLPAGPDTLHHRAAGRLEAFSCHVVRDRCAIRAMAMLEDSEDIEPAGALAFACLLYLADRHEAAQFWWQFAAGAGLSAAAFCLHLHHLQYSEHAIARHWRSQTVALRCQCPGWPLPGQDRSAQGQGGCWPPGLLETVVAGLLRDDAEPAWARDPQPAGPGGFRWWVFSTPLTDALRRLDVEGDEEYGTIPKPDPELAAELEACAATAP